MKDLSVGWLKKDGRQDSGAFKVKTNKRQF